MEQVKKVREMLMVQKSFDHQLRWQVYLPLFKIYDGYFFSSQVVAWDFFHQQ